MFLYFLKLQINLECFKEFSQSLLSHRRLPLHQHKVHHLESQPYQPSQRGHHLKEATGRKRTSKRK